MINEQMGLVERRFAEIIWENEPVSSTKLVALAAEALKWKKSTTYTVLKKLCEKGFFQNKDSIVTSIISKEDYLASSSYGFGEKSFNGSLPAFVAAFSANHKITEKERNEILKIIGVKND
jgi:predicted transcriptional regulator